MRAAALLLILTAIAGAQDATDILQKLAEHTRALESFHAEATVEVARGVGMRREAAETKLSIWAVDGARKLAIDYKGMTAEIQFVTDGATMWTYLPKQRMYTKVAAAAAATEDSSADISGDNPALTTFGTVISRYANFNKGRIGATVTGEENIKQAGKKVRCWVLRCNFADRSEKIWIDQERFLALRSEFTLGNEGVPLEVRIDLKRFDLGPVDHAFTLEVPEAAQLVEELQIPGMAQQSFIGKPAADFSLKNLDGERVRLSDFRGKIVVLDFWATWCPPCREELPTVEKLANQLSDRNVVVLGINDEGSGTVKSFNRKHNYTFITLEDSGRKVSELYRARAIPAVFVIDRNGVIVSHLVGGRGEDQLFSAIRAAGLEN
jgi:peroxiredoxin/outer membrane lipoprotein-sorting protein